MTRRWKFELQTDSVTLSHYIHDDGTWEWDQATPPLQPEDIRDLVHRLDEGRRQFERLGWTKGEFKRLP